MIARLRRVLVDVVPLKRGEWKLALFLYGVLTLMVAADWVGKLGADALFVKRYGVDKIPQMYIVTPLVMLLVSGVIFYFVDRVRSRTMFLWYVASVTVASLALQWAITGSQGSESVIQPISYIFAHGVKETIYILFWVYAGNLYDADQSKRLFPFFAGSVLVGKILGGAVGAALAPVIHAENFIGAQAVGFAVCLVAILLFRDLPEGEGSRVALGHRPSGVRESLRDTLDGYRAVASDRLLRVFGVGVFFWYFLMQFANFLYLVGLDVTAAGKTVQSEDVFSVLYASVYTSASLVALFIQSVFTTPLVRRFGVARVLFALPAWYLLTYALAAYAYGAQVAGLVFWAAVALQLGERIVIPAVHRPAAELIYSQIDVAIRRRARAFLSGGVNAVGNMAAAAALIAGLAVLSTTWLLAAGAVFSAIFTANTWLTRRAFGRRIAENLGSADPATRKNAVDMLAAEGGAVPTDLLRSVAEAGSDEVANGARLALTRRGVLAVATDAVK